MNYLPLTPNEKTQYKNLLGENFDPFKSIPEQCRFTTPLGIPHAQDEYSLQQHFKSLADANRSIDISLLGAGAYNHFIPESVNAIASRPEFFTAYTPYQPEISQGTLQAIFEYQSYMAELLNMDVVNASMYDGATAMAEAALMAIRLKRIKRVVISGTLHPHYRAVTHTYLDKRGMTVYTIPAKNGATTYEDTRSALSEPASALIVGYPNFYGQLEDLSEFQKITSDANTLLIAVCMEPLAFGVIEPPGSFGADIVCGEAQSFGVPLNYGGPYVGIFATKRGYIRNMPGRLVSQTTDRSGKTGYVVTLSTREQHIRREKATSNICTNQSLCALRVLAFLSLLGAQGITRLSRINYNLAHYLRSQLLTIPGVTDPCRTSDFFNEFCITIPGGSKTFNSLLHRGIHFGILIEPFDPALKDTFLVAVTEKNSKDDLNRTVRVIREIVTSQP